LSCAWRLGVCENILLDGAGICPDCSAAEVEKVVELDKKLISAEMTKEVVLTYQQVVLLP
jgi:hypothetical protein